MIPWFKKLFTDEGAFLVVWNKVKPNKASILRAAIVITSLMVNRGILPGGESAVGYWTSLVGMFLPIIMGAGDKNPTPEELVAMLQKIGPMPAKALLDDLHQKANTAPEDPNIQKV